MSQQLLHHFELCADASQQSRVSMPERVPSESFLNSEPLRNGTNVLAQNRLAPHWPATPVSAACENPVVGSDIARNFLPFRERLQNNWMNRHRFLRRFCLAWTYDSAHDRPRDAHCPLSKIDVSPLQSEQLALPQARGGCDEHQRPLSQSQNID